MVHTSLNAKLGKVYPYRTATVSSRVVEADLMQEQESYDWLRNLLGKKWDNHICWELVTTDGKVAYCQWSDWKLYIGLSIVERSW